MFFCVGQWKAHLAYRLPVTHIKQMDVEQVEK